MNTFQKPINSEITPAGEQFLIAADRELILSCTDATADELTEIVRAVNSKHEAEMFFDELLNHVETLTAITEEYNVRTLADLMYLQLAILKGGFIDHYPGESKVLELVNALPSGERWATFIHVDEPS